MINLLEDLYAPVMHAPTIEDFKVELVKFGKKLGFDLVIADWRGPPPSRGVVSINNYSRAWLEIQAQTSDEQLAQDPIIQHALRNPHPILWDAATYRSAGWHDFADQFQQHGFKAGFDIPIHSMSGAKLQLGFARDESLPVDRAEMVRVLGEGQLFASFAFPALERLLAHSTHPDFPKLTPKEMEVLKWTVAGKTAFEVGAILGSTERTANFHVQNICTKLGVFNKRAAIAKALELKLIV